jgi:endonuclease/exonuclease/phosphatase family metal-dependent hydrolase
MKIATLNIDWAKTLKSTATEAFINQFEFDILVITEGIDLNLPNFPYKYLCEPIPENTVYEGLNYSEYLAGQTAYRTIIYSKYPRVKQYEVTDSRTALAAELQTPFGNIVIYAAIVGTWFNKKPYARIELDNLIADCQSICEENPNLIIVGDLNTSFRENEKQYCISGATTQALTTLFKDLDLIIPTNTLDENIDHIVIPKAFENKVISTNVFVNKDIVSDHKGVYITLL